MPCNNQRPVYVKNRLHVLNADDIIPVEGGFRHVPENLRGFKNTGMQQGYYLLIDCGRCYSCRVKAINSRAGSMLAESQYSQNSAFLTLTYANDPGSNGRGDLAHKMLLKRHIREFTERMRMDRTLGRLRWFCAGENGPLHGRSHWHMILFGVDGRFPDFDYSAKMSHSRLWPYGHINAKPLPDGKAMSYVAKYSVKSMAALRDDGDFMPGHEVATSYSKYPPLGADFFDDLGYRQADLGVPLSFHYLPPGGDRKANYSVKGGKSRAIVADAYIEQLAAMGYDVSFFGRCPSGHTPQGPLIPISPNKWVNKVIGEVVRQRNLTFLPDETPRAALASIKADFAEREAQQERLNAQLFKRREAAAIERAKARNEFFKLSARDDPDDPFWSDYDEAQSMARVIGHRRW